jgi:predicted DNA-binding transcriptional regulator AlpA
MATEVFWSLADVARYMGVSRSAVAQAKLPEPDALVGKARGWRPETIKAWIPTRPGKGVGGGRPRKQPKE